jgi:hypothetical protein
VCAVECAVAMSQPLRNTVGISCTERDDGRYVTSSNSAPLKLAVTERTYLYMSTYFLFALETIRPIAGTLVPETFILSLSTPNMNHRDMRRQLGASREEESTFLPFTFMYTTARMGIILAHRRRGPRRGSSQMRFLYPSIIVEARWIVLTNRRVE